jgi:hypothetical protein
VVSTLALSPPINSDTPLTRISHVKQSLPDRVAAMPEVSGVTAAENKWIVVTGAAPLLHELYMLHLLLLSIMTP